jgi:hypothetical protein
MYTSPTTMASATTARILINGKPVKIFTDGQGQSWVEAREGSKYQIEVKNNSANRVLCITSIDGINILSGEEASLEPDNGYVINPFSSLKVDGWRISDDKVKEFLFTFDKSKSYSVKLGAGAKNLGVIGIAIFEEKKYEIPWTFDSTGTTKWAQPSWITYTADSTGDHYGGMEFNSSSGYINSAGVTLTSCFASSIEQPTKSTTLRSMDVDFKAGTAKGKELDSKCTTVGFQAGSLIQTHSIYYDSFDNLVKRGIITENKMPQPFKTTKYCKDI